MPNTKIVATLGPATDPPGMLGQLLDAGVDVFRLNASHGMPEQHAARIATVRAAARGSRSYPGILLDLQGPKIRLCFAGGTGTLEAGAAFTITTETGCRRQLRDGFHQLRQLRQRCETWRSRPPG